MIAIKAKVNEKGEIKLPRLDVFRGKKVNVIVKASESSFGFWENEIDDETWNTA